MNVCSPRNVKRIPIIEALVLTPFCVHFIFFLDSMDIVD